MAQRLDIGVVGCGMAGMAAALYLARDGHRVTLFDRFAEPRPLGAGLLLQPTGQAVLRDLGLLPQVVAGAARIDRLESRNDRNWALLDLPYALASHGHGLGVHRARLFDALWQAVQRQPGISQAFGAGVAAIEDDGRAIVLEGGSRSRFDLLVVAAGSHSPLRRHFAVRRDWLYPWGCLWATVPLPPGAPPDQLRQRVRGAHVMLGLLPVGQGEAALFWSLRNDRVAAWRATPLDAWQQAVATIWPEAGMALAGLQSHGQLTHAVYRDAALHDPVRGAAIAIGDTAHATSPQLGQGANLALLDAAVLATSLRTMPVAAALRHYAEMRRAHHACYRWASRLLTPFFQADAAALGWLRDLALPLAHQLPWLRRRMVETLAGMAAGPLRNIDMAALLPDMAPGAEP